MLIPNLSPEEIQCIGCDCVKSVDEIDWELHDQAGVIVCIDCVDIIDDFIGRRD
jgi:hypothetical protein